MRNRDFLRRFADFNFRLIVLAAAHSRQLVNAAEHRARFGSNQIFTDAEAVQLCTLHQQIAHNVLIQRIGCTNAAVGIARLVQHFAHFFREIGNIARVDAHSFRTNAHWRQNLIKHANGVGNTAFQHVVGVYQKRTVVGIQLCITGKRFILAGEHLHPAVRHRSQRRDAELTICQNARRSHYAADIRGARAEHRAVIALGAAAAELHYGQPFCCAHYAVGFRTN